MPNKEIRLDKYISDMGIVSRREAKNLLKKKLVKVNLKIVTDGKTKVNLLNDKVEYNGEVLEYKENIYIMLNKPKDYISATEDKKEKTVIDLIDKKYNVKSLFPVGRLDKDTEGLLLLTNDGDFSHNITSPKKHIYKKYYVKLKIDLNDDDIAILENGVKLSSEFTTKKSKVEKINNMEALISISEGKFHQVKRMFKSIGNEVTYLKRIQIGELELDKKLGTGNYRELSKNELRSIFE